MLSKIPHVTIFLGACLLFGVQPLIGGCLLPVFGGASNVWTVCLCAFQVLLVVGYVYAHFQSRQLSRLKLLVHVAMIAIAGVWMLIVALRGHVAMVACVASLPPALGALILVLMIVGLPYVLLSANSSLVQVLYGRMRADANVYRLYATSNAGSLCGLMAYPFVLEPMLSLSQMYFVLAAGLIVYAVLFCAMIRRGVNEREVGNFDNVGSGSGGQAKSDICGWVLLSAFSCFLLNAVTAYLCQGVAPLPMLWVLLLGVYLLSWVIGFSDVDRRVSIAAGITTLCASVLAIALLYCHRDGVYMVKLVVGICVLAGGCVSAHQTLYRNRPTVERLTRYYMAIAIGGAIGGSVASLLFPSIFSWLAEYPVAVVVAIVIAVLSLKADLKTLPSCFQGRAVHFCLWPVSALLLGVALYGGYGVDGTLISRGRNFYAITSVQTRIAKDSQGKEYKAVTMDNNGTVHGYQAISYGSKSQIPTAYYTRSGGGMGVLHHPLRRQNRPIRAAFCGMGIGTMSVYGEEGDLFRFYEIDPLVISIATNAECFTFISSSRAKVEIVEGDARHSLEMERDSGAEKYDLIVVDVFSGDSIPAHMATREAFELYLDRLAPGGLLAFHLSNWHLDMSPMVKAASRELGLELFGCRTTPDPGLPYEAASYWAYLSRGPIGFTLRNNQSRVDYSSVKDIPLMTDDKHSLLPYLHIRQSVLSFF